MSVSPPPRRRFGCLAYGCLISLILIALSGAGILWLVRSGIRNAVVTFTGTAPISVEAPPISPKEVRESEDRVARLKALLSSPNQAGTVSLNGTDLNTIIKELGLTGKASAAVVGDTLSVKFSLPLASLGPWELASSAGFGDLLGRYVSGDLSSAVEVTDGVPRIALQNLTLNGSTFEADALTAANKWLTGFLESAGQGSESASSLNRVKSLKVAKGEVWVTFRSE